MTNLQCLLVTVRISANRVGVELRPLPVLYDQPTMTVMEAQVIQETEWVLSCIPVSSV